MATPVLGPAARATRPHVLDRGPTGLLVAIILAVGAFEALWFGVVTGSGLAAFDPAVIDWVAAHRSPALVLAAEVVTNAGSPTVSIGAMVVAIAWWAWRRDGRTVAYGSIGLGLLLVVDVGTKAMVARPRPPAVLHVVAAQGYSFPSGHAMLSGGAVLLLTWLLARRGALPAPAARRGLLAGIAALLLVAIAASRVVLGVHYPDDVLAGWALAVLVVALLAFAARLADRSVRA